MARHAWTRAVTSPFVAAPHSDASWFHYQELLSQVPAAPDEEKELVLFLQQRWLAKASGFFPFEVNWLCPFFGVEVQAHPETTQSYARDPSRCLSATYKVKMEAWKRLLPHPASFPLILTRPFDLDERLPHYLGISPGTTMEAVVERLVVDSRDNQVTVDLTHVLPVAISSRQEWLSSWKRFCGLCKERKVDAAKVICIQQLQGGAIGGIRFLPLNGPFAKETAMQRQFLLNWIALFGLTATKLELDRSFLQTALRVSTKAVVTEEIVDWFSKKEEFLSWLYATRQCWKSTHPQKSLMFDATITLLKGLIENEVNWSKTFENPTKAVIVHLSFLEIRRHLELLIQEEKTASFFDVTSRLEQIHAHLSSLLAVCVPFSSSDFPAIYSRALHSTPASLKPLAAYGIHASGMTSLTSVLVAVQKQVGGHFRALYGENTYFEAIHALNLVSQPKCVLEATEEDWKGADLILTQFHPVLRRDDLHTSEYQVEKTIELLRAHLETRGGKPLTLVIDCTVDAIDSSRVGAALELFQKEIEKGTLNVICFRSGLKFDLFGMDNYFASPFFMIHDKSKTWNGFDSLLKDPALQADWLSVNWFCLAYKHVPLQLEAYRRQIIDNTRALLDRIPSTLYESHASYRVTPVQEKVDASFIELKLFGPFHQWRASTVLGGGLYLGCLQQGLPIFCRRSFGFYHANFSLIFDDNSTSMRLTLGLDPAEIDTFVTCFEEIAHLKQPL